jgi:flagellar biosynthesis protein FlhG
MNRMNQNTKRGELGMESRTQVRQKRIVPSNVNRLRGRDVTRVLSFTSGKGGVGKTHTVTNVGIGLANLLNQGRSVLILDADLGLANVDVLLGLKPKGNLHDVLKGKARLDDIILEGPGGISIIPAASGVEEIQSLDTDSKMFLMQEIERVADHYDYLLIDTPAGIGSDVMYFNSAAAEVVCVINGEPTSLTDSYALIKVLSSKYGEKKVSVVVNNVASEDEAHGAYKKLAGAVERFLRVDLSYLGWVPNDPVVKECIMGQIPVAAQFPTSKAGLALSSVARRIDEVGSGHRIKGGMQLFFRQLLEVTSYGEEASC